MVVTTGISTRVQTAKPFADSAGAETLLVSFGENIYRERDRWGWDDTLWQSVLKKYRYNFSETK
jgi:hypothetical protein